MMRVLIIEDEKPLANLWKMAFERVQFEVIWIADGRAAIEWLDQNPLPDVVISDQMLPNVTGDKILRHIKTIDPTNHVKTMLVSAAPESIPPDIEDYADMVLQKPMYFSDLVTFAQRIAKS